jgi:hypothetical protein
VGFGDGAVVEVVPVEWSPPRRALGSMD